MTCLWNFLGLWNHHGPRWDQTKSWADPGHGSAKCRGWASWKLKLFGNFFGGARPGMIFFLGLRVWSYQFWVFSFFFQLREAFFCWSRSFFWGEKNHEARSSLLTVAGARSSTFYRGARWGACWDPQVLNGKFYGKGWFRALVIFGDKDVFANSEWTMKWNDCELCLKK